MAGSLRQLADGVGRSHVVVQRWVQRPDWPFAVKPPWNIAEVRQWAETTLGPNPAEDAGDGNGQSAMDGLAALRRNPLGAAKLKLTLTRAAKLDLERAALAGELINRRDVERGFVRRVYAVQAAFECLPRLLAGRLVGLKEPEIEAILDEGIRAVLLEMSQRPELPQVPGMETTT
jgi:hypothetical protein